MELPTAQPAGNLRLIEKPHVKQAGQPDRHWTANFEKSPDRLSSLDDSSKSASSFFHTLYLYLMPL